MTHELICLYGLAKTGKIIGYSFLYNITVYQFTEGIYCAQCDSKGLPTAFTVLFFDDLGNSQMVSRSFMDNANKAIINDFVLRRFTKTK